MELQQSVWKNFLSDIEIPAGITRLTVIDQP
jgi:hypothetical protein